MPTEQTFDDAYWAYLYTQFACINGEDTPALRAAYHMVRHDLEAACHAAGIDPATVFED